MVRRLLYKDDLKKVKEGIDKAANLVKVTLGASGKTVMLKTSWVHQQHGRLQGATTVTKDGVSVLRRIEIMDDVVQNMGVDLLKQAAEKTMNDAGDATTTTCVLLQAIVNAAFDSIDNGANALNVKKGIDLGVVEVVKQLKAMSTPVDENSDSLLHVATVSANNDLEIGKLIAEAFLRMGKDGIIDIGISQNGKTEMQLSDGVKFNKGWASPYFVNNVAKGECTLIHPYILLYEKKLFTFSKVLDPIFQKVSATNRPLLVICDGIDGEALATLVHNAASKVYACCAVGVPEQGPLKNQAMEDLALLVDGKYVSEEKGMSLKNLTLNDLGEAEKVIIGREFTNIISPLVTSSNGEKLKELVDNLKMDLTKVGGYEKEQIEKRIANLTSGVAILNVGAPTDVELNEKKDRCDDSVRAVKAAIAEGFVPGGGTAFLRVKEEEAQEANGILTGKRAVLLAIREPFKQILRNAGIEEKEVESLVREIQNGSNNNVGYNVISEKIEDMVAAGIIDPTKALRVALENAASAAGVLITSGGGIVDSL